MSDPISKWNQIPRSAEIVGAALDSLLVNRPSAVPFANNGLGRYADLIAGWDAQSQLAISRLVKEAIAKRIGLASGEELTELCRSEFSTDREVDSKTTSIGTLSLTRPNTSGGAGVIVAGTRLYRPANISATPSVPGGQYIITQDCFFPSVTKTINAVPFKAQQVGSAGNALDLYGYPTLKFSDTPFDSTITVASYEISGGADEKDDQDLVNESLAYAIGKYGPTIGSIYAGALRGTGVRHAAVIDVSQLSNGSPAAYTGVLVADESWAGYNGGSPGAWIQSVQQQLQDPVNGFVGVGESAIVTAPSNIPIYVQCIVMLTDQNYAAFTVDITSNIQKSLKNYFDNRSDWYTFTTAGVQAAISQADFRIRQCTFASVFNSSSNTVISDPTTPYIATSTGIQASHYYLVNNGVIVVFIPPA